MYASSADLDISDATAPSSAEQHAAMAWALLGPNHRGNITFEAIKPDEGGGEGGEKAGSGEWGSKAQQLATVTSPRRLSSSLRYAQTLWRARARLPPSPPLGPPPPFLLFPLTWLTFLTARREAVNPCCPSKRGPLLYVLNQPA